MKIRLIPILFFKNGNLVRSENFDLHQILGDPFVQVERYNTWNVDEIIYINISNSANYEIKNKTEQHSKTFLEVMKKASERCFSPIVFGGGIKNLNDAKTYFQNGADKISINSSCVGNTDLISEFANTFGRQSVIVSIDVKLENNLYKLYNSQNEKTYDYDLFDYIKEVEKKGAGEILLNSIDRDGTGLGYDIDLIKKVNDIINIPLIPCGGVGNSDHISELLEKVDLSAVAAGNIFNFTERSYGKIKNFMKEKGYNFR